MTALNLQGAAAEEARVNRQATRVPWWAPLLIPVVVLTLTAMSSASRGPHVVDSTSVSALSGAVLMALLVGLPSFIAGTLYRRPTEARLDDAATSRTETGPV